MTINMFAAILSILVLAVLPNLFALLFFRRGKQLTSYRKLLKVGLILAASVFLIDALTHLLPEAGELAIEQGMQREITWVIAILGILVFGTFEQVLHRITGFHHDGRDHKDIGWINLVADGLHNFIDGIAIAAAFTISIDLGVITVFGVILHELPQEVGDFGVLLYSGFSWRSAVIANLVISFFALLGLLLFYSIQPLFEQIEYILLSLLAGGFVYIALFALLPEIMSNRKWEA